MEFLDLLNKVARFTRPAHQSLAPLDRMDQPFVETELDSLDGLIVVMYFSIIYDIHDDLVKDFHPQTPQELFDFIEQEKKRECVSIEEAMEMIK
jgi:hypothetical protein